MATLGDPVVGQRPREQHLVVRNIVVVAWKEYVRSE